MPDQINGLPAHILLVHAVIVLFPLAAALLVLSAVWPAARRKLGVITPIAAFVSLVFVPLATNAGEWLRDHLNGNLTDTALVRDHTEKGDGLLPWALGVLVLALAVWWVGRAYGLEWSGGDDTAGRDGHGRAGSTADDGGGVALATRETRTSRRSLPVWATAAFAVASVAVAAVGTVVLVQIGDSGSKAVWTGNVSQTVTGHPRGDGG